MGIASKTWGVALALWVTAAAGCGRVGYDVDRAADAGPGPDVGVPADAAMDSLAGDSGEGDAAVLDSATGDSGMLDGGAVDSSTVDDGATPDAAAPPLSLVLPCAAAAMVDTPYACTASTRALLAGETLAWVMTPTHTCDFLSIDPASGAITGVPSSAAVGACVLSIGVSSSLGVVDTARTTVTVTGPTIREVDIGAWHTCALSTAGAVRCWGSNGAGQLGYDDTVNVGNGAAGRSITDMGDVSIGGPVQQISLGYQQTCALLTTGNVRCWGGGRFGRLGYAHLNDVGAGGAGGSILSNGDVPIGGTATRVATGGVGGCALMTTGGVRCWGLYHGYGSTSVVNGDAIALMGDVPIGTGPIVDIAAGYDHFCALTGDGRVRCWGQNWAGALGYGHTDSVGDGAPGRSIIDMGDVPVGGRVVQLSAGDQTTCAVLDTGALRCWGWNAYGQLGYDDTVDVGTGAVGRAITDMGDVPVGSGVSWAWAGEEHSCAVTTSGGVRCWGVNSYGQLGYGDTTSVGDGTAGRSIIDMGDVPVGAGVAKVFTTDWDSGHTCAFLTTNGIRCWGNNSSGQLGHDNTLDIGDGGPGGTIIAAGDVLPF